MTIAARFGAAGHTHSHHLTPATQQSDPLPALPAVLPSQPWLSVDLGSPFYITAVVIRLRPGGVGASRLGNAEVRVGLTPIRSEPDDRPGLILNRLCGGRIATAAAPLAQGQDVVSVECGRPGSPPAGQWVTLQNFHPAGELLQVSV